MIKVSKWILHYYYITTKRCIALNQFVFNLITTNTGVSGGPQQMFALGPPLWVNPATFMGQAKWSTDVLWWKSPSFLQNNCTKAYKIYTWCCFQGLCQSPHVWLHLFLVLHQEICSDKQTSDKRRLGPGERPLQNSFKVLRRFNGWKLFKKPFMLFFLWRRLSLPILHHFLSWHLINKSVRLLFNIALTLFLGR